MVRKRIRYGQNFIKAPDLAASIVARADLSSDEVVIEVGPGEGIFTVELAKRVGRVVAYEIDTDLATRLRKLTTRLPNVEVVTGDFLECPMPDGPFSTFSNLPFNITADAVRRFKSAPDLRCAYLGVQREAAQKHCGDPVETESSILAKPWFEFCWFHHFDREDFEPVPAVDVDIFRMARRDHPLLPPEDREAYTRFVRYGFRSTKADLKAGFSKVFSYTQWKRLARDLHFPVNALPTQLNVDQWTSLYRYFTAGVTDDKKRITGLHP